MPRELVADDGAQDMADPLADTPQRGGVLVQEKSSDGSASNSENDSSYGELGPHGQEGSRMIYAERPILPGLQGLHELLYKQRSTVESTFFRAAGTNELHARRGLGRLIGTKAMGARFNFR